MDLDDFTNINDIPQATDPLTDDVENAFQIDEPTISDEADEDPKPKRVRKNLDQQIAATEEKLRKLKAKRRSDKEKARRHRLIETGAVVEAATGIQFIEKADRERLSAILRETHQHDDGGTWTWADAIASEYDRRLADGGER